MKYSLLPSVLMCLLPITSLADTLRSQYPAKIPVDQQGDIPTVVVSAPRLAADSIDTDFQTGRVTVISHREFDGDVATVADVLRKEAGVQVRQFGGLGSFSSVNIRGSSSAQVNVYVDGILINGAYGGAVDLGQFSLNGVDKIEIYRGNTPVQLGASGVGGSIHIKTRKSGDEPTRQLSLGFGSFNTRKLATSVSDKFNNTRFVFTADYLSSDNDFGLLNNNGTPLNPYDDFADRRNNAGFHQENLLFSAEHAYQNHSYLTLVIQHTNKDQQITDRVNSSSNTAYYDTGLTSVQVKLDHWLADESALALKLFLSDKSEHFVDKLSKIGLDRNNQKGFTQTIGSSISFSKTAGSHVLNSQLELKKEQYRQSDAIQNERSEYQRVQLTAGFQDEWLSSNSAWLVNLAGRLFYLENQADFPNTRETSDWHQSAQAGVLYSVTSAIKFRANLSRDIRLPSLWELYGDSGYSLGNEKLLPETAINMDAGLEYSGSEFTGAATFFVRKLDDAVVNIFNARGIGKAENISSAKVSGVEFEINYQPVTELQLRVRTTIQQSEDTSDTVFSGRSLPGISTLENYLSLTLSAEPVSVILEHEHRSGGFYDRTESRAILELQQVNLIAKWTYKARSVEIGIDNLTASDSEQFNGYQAPGRSFTASYRQQF